jgi:hypothetical protein
LGLAGWLALQMRRRLLLLLLAAACCWLLHGSREMAQRPKPMSRQVSIADVTEGS